MKDFTLFIYQALLTALQDQNYQFQTFAEFLQNPAERVILLRHDVDDRKTHSLEFARIQHARGITGTYYFRVVPQSFDPSVIRQIQALGHEIGYHYEDMDFAAGNPHEAVRSFENNLKKLRALVPINTICMHGSPRSKFDNKDVWKHYDYKKYDILGEPYFDINFQEVFYLTDTGRRWDGDKVSVRDKVEHPLGPTFHSTFQIIEAIQQGNFPAKVMFTFHPQRWTNKKALWIQEKYSQSIKNIVKYWLIKTRQPL